MKIYANRDINSEEYKVSKINQLMGKDLWVLADFTLHDTEHLKLYIKFTEWRYDRALIHFINYDSLVRGVYGLYTEQEIYDMISERNWFTSSVDRIDTDFKEIISTDELYDIIKNIPYLG